MTLDDKVMDYFSGWKSIRLEEENIENNKTRLHKEKVKLHSKADEIKELMKTENFADSYLGYCFLRYEIRGQEKLGEIKNFAYKMQKNINSKLLVFNEGGKGYSTAIGYGEREIPYEIIIGRLKEPCIEITKNNNLIACVENAQSIDAHDHVGFTRYGYEIRLDDFADMHTYTDDHTKNGFEIAIPVPFNFHKDLTIGGSRTYNSDIISKLIVGDKRVDKFIDSLDLAVYTKSKAKIPEI